MRKIAILLLFLTLGLLTMGCRRIDGPRFWWDDRSQERLSESYTLPDDPAAPADSGGDERSSPSGSDLTDDNLRDFRTDLDREEEKRKSDSSLLDF